jgi:uncharacterized protein YdcH (DUF465 family)
VRFDLRTEPTDDAMIEEFKKRRLKLKDEIASFLAKVEHRM